MRFFNYLVILLGCLCALGNFFPAFELVAHFQPWVLVFICLQLLLALIRRHLGASAILLGLTVYHLYITAPFINFDLLLETRSEYPTEKTEPHQPFRILQFNINADNPRHDELAQAIEVVDADILVICEANNHILTRLTHLHSKYPYRIEVARWPNKVLFAVTGTVIWSRFPFIKSETIVLEQGKINVAHTEVEIGKQAVSIYAAHPYAPHNKTHTRYRNEGILELASLVKQDPNPNTMLIGDLNQTLWASGTRKLLKMTQLQSVFKGRMFLSTWPTSTYPIGIAIDHILYRGNLSCTGTGSLDGIGSDHRMLIAEFISPNWTSNP